MLDKKKNLLLTLFAIIPLGSAHASDCPWINTPMAPHDSTALIEELVRSEADASQPSITYQVKLVNLSDAGSAIQSRSKLFSYAIEPEPKDSE
jgi:hypothetical protein